MRGRIFPVIGCVLLPAALAAQPAAVPAADVRGRVVDAVSGAPVAGALVELGDLGRRAVADASGSFAFERVPAGTHQWVISRVGYARWEESTEVEDGDELTIALLPRAEVLEGITAVASQLSHRREVSGVAVRTLERTTLRLTAAPSAFELVADHLGVRAVPCPAHLTASGLEPDGGEPDSGEPSRTGGRRNRVRTGPTNGDGGDVSCAWIRGGIARPVVYIDEQRANGGLSDLLNVRAQELFSVESYSGGQMIRVISVPFAEQVARGRAALLPLSF